jgi:hypothetical protein
MSTPPTWVAHAQRVYDSIGWADLPSDPKFGCITPPPFGSQCTLPREAAIAACIAMPRCVAVTCPDPAESHINDAAWAQRHGSAPHGPVCQLRAKRTPNEKGHGMCRPGGCMNVALSRIRRPPALHTWRSLGAPDQPLRNPALLFLHGDAQLHSLLLPRGVGHYWPLDGAALAADEASALPNTGMLWLVDAVPMNASAGASSRYPRPDLWRAERGRSGMTRRDRQGPGRRAARRSGSRWHDD